jgi:molecular chaperone DnaK (HSP70)
MSTLGIDLGTANSAAFFSDGQAKPRAIRAREGASDYGKDFPSYVEFDQAGEKLCVGNVAYTHYCDGTTNRVVWGSKRLIGISFREAKKELRHLDYPIEERKEDGTVSIPVHSRSYTPGDIATMILDKIKEDALNKGLNTIGKISRVIVSHPAYFESSRIEATLHAVRQAFEDILPEKSIERVPEPVAAALGYGLEVVACVIDLGAGTLDIVTAVLSKDEEGKLDIMTDQALGNAAFGGIDIDGLIIDWVIREYGFAEFEKMRRLDVVQENDSVTLELHRELQKLRSRVEKAKIHLSNPKINRQDVDVRYREAMEVITITKEVLDRLMDAPLPRERVDEFFGFSLSDEEMSKVQEALKEFHPGEGRELPSLLDILRMTIKNSLAKGNYKTQDIDHVLLVGGPMHMPCVRKAIGQVFAANEAVVQELERIEREGFPVDPMECVARGASLYGGPIDGTLNFYYAIATDEEEGTGSKTYVYYDDESWLQRGDNVPKQNLARRQGIKWPGIEEIPITLLQGKVDIAVPDSKRILWKKSMTYGFTPVYDRERKANYSITLDVDRDQIVNCVVEDKVSRKKYSFARLSRQVGEILEPKDYEVVPGSQRIPDRVTVKRLRGLPGFLDYLSLLATSWLMKRHTAEEEKNRSTTTQEQSGACN